MSGPIGRLLRRFGDEGGQSLVIAAFGLIAVLACVGLSVDVGHLRYVKRQLQMAADAAAIAGALEVNTCSGTGTCSAMTMAAKSSLVENGLTGSTLVTNCATTAVSGLELMVNNGPCSLGSSDPNAGLATYVEVVLKYPTPLYFGKVLGLNTLPISVRSEAAQTDGNYCMYALNKTASHSFVVSGATLNSTCGIIVESSSSTAGYCSSGAVNASFIAVVGSATVSNCTVNATYELGASLPVPSNPLAKLPAPAVPSCGSSTSSPYYGAASAVTITGTAILYPTYAYCGGITIKSGASVTFEPGTFVLTSTNGSKTVSPGGLTMQIGAKVSGTGVLFYNYGPSGGVTMSYTSSSNGISLAAQTSGNYSGVLFFQDAGNTAAATITGAAAWNTVLDGTLYFPSAAVTYSNSGTSAYNFLIADTITITSSSSTSSTMCANNNNYKTLSSGGSPLGVGAMCVQ